MRRSESMGLAERVYFHVAGKGGWCAGCWNEYGIHIQAPCGWRQGAERVLAGRP